MDRVTHTKSNASVVVQNPVEYTTPSVFYTEAMKGVSICVLVLCAVVGTRACGKGSTTTTIPPTVEPEIIAATAPGSSQAGRAPSGPGLSNVEMQTLSESLFSADSGVAQISINPQGRTSSAAVSDMASSRLISSVPSSAMDKETVKLMQKLLDNYEPQTNRRESYTNAEKEEENQFLDALMRTQVMQTLQTYLKNKGMLSGNLRDTLKSIWFTQYRRGSSNIGSSGFEHVFVGELKGGKVAGFHNWQNFKKEEEEGDLDYKGYMKRVDLGGKGEIIKVRFMWLNEPKPVGSLFVGTTPELEMALYTACFIARPDAKCPVKLANKKFNIQTWTYTNRGKKVIGSAYPDI